MNEDVFLCPEHKEFINQPMPGDKISVDHRIEASLIVRNLLEKLSIDAVAHKLGIHRTYVYFAASIQTQCRKDAVRYLCPVGVIRKILAWSKKQ